MSQQGWLVRMAIVGLAALVGVNVVACAPASGPVANAGPDQVVDPGVLVTLNGTGSYDPNGSPLNFAWAQLTGTFVVLNGTNTSAPTFVAPSVSVTLSFQLTVSNGQGATSSASVTIRVAAGGGNLPPVADAGRGQTVAVGSLVTLDGTGSTDPDGDHLSFAWAQVAGFPVALSDPNTAQPTFVALNVPGTLTFKLTVSDGTRPSSATVNVAVFTAPVLFVANLTGNSVVSFVDPAALSGNVTADHILVGASTRISEPAAVALDAGGRLVVSNFATPALSIYANGLGAGGEQAPSAVVVGPDTQFTAPVALAGNAARDLVFVADTATSRVLVFRDASKPTFDGNVAPARTITSTDLVAPLGMSLAANDDLYLASATLHRIVVISGASDANGTIAATRVINSTAFVHPIGVFVDLQDTLYVVDEVSDQILSFGAASTRRGAVIPDFALRIPGAGALTAVVVDQAGVGYITDRTQNAIYVYENLTMRSGLQAPDRTIQGLGTGLSGPARMFLLQ